MPQGEVMWQLGDIHEKLGNHGKAGSVGFVSRPPWLEENHGLIGICLRSVDQFDPCNESSCCILVGVWPIRRNVSIDVTMYVYIYLSVYTRQIIPSNIFCNAGCQRNAEHMTWAMR